MSIHASEMTVAEIESRVGVRPVPEVVPFAPPEEGESLNRTFGSRPAPQRAQLEIEIGVVPILQLIRAELSSVIEQGKAALMKPERMGLGQPGFDSVSLKALVDLVGGSMQLCEHLVFQPGLSVPERLTAVALGSYMEKFEYNFFGLETESIGRSDMKGLLPALQEFKQVCLELELKLLLGEQVEEKNAAA